MAEKKSKIKVFEKKELFIIQGQWKNRLKKKAK